MSNRHSNLEIATKLLFYAHMIASIAIHATIAKKTSHNLYNKSN